MRVDGEQGRCGYEGQRVRSRGENSVRAQPARRFDSRTRRLCAGHGAMIVPVLRPSRADQRDASWRKAHSMRGTLEIFGENQAKIRQRAAIAGNIEEHAATDDRAYRLN